MIQYECVYCATAGINVVVITHDELKSLGQIFLIQICM